MSCEVLLYAALNGATDEENNIQVKSLYSFRDPEQIRRLKDRRIPCVRISRLWAVSTDPAGIHTVSSVAVRKKCVGLQYPVPLFLGFRNQVRLLEPGRLVGQHGGGYFAAHVEVLHGRLRMAYS